MSVLACTVPGVPVPQGSMRAYGGRVVASNGVRLRPYRQSVASVAGDALHRADGWDRGAAVRVAVEFWWPRPKAHYLAAGLRPDAPRWRSTRPDIDKLCRAVLDGCTDAGVWVDDAQVVELVAVKRWCDRADRARTVVEVGSVA